MHVYIQTSDLVLALYIYCSISLLLTLVLNLNIPQKFFYLITMISRFLSSTFFKSRNSPHHSPTSPRYLPSPSSPCSLPSSPRHEPPFMSISPTRDNRFGTNLSVPQLKPPKLDVSCDALPGMITKPRNIPVDVLNTYGMKHCYDTPKKITNATPDGKL